MPGFASCELAGNRLLELGFRVAGKSPVSEAVYYQLEDWPGIIRVAQHRPSHRRHPLPLIARITFSPQRIRAFDPALVDDTVAKAVGRYLIHFWPRLLVERADILKHSLLDQTARNNTAAAGTVALLSSARATLAESQRLVEESRMLIERARRNGVDFGLKVA